MSNVLTTEAKRSLDRGTRARYLFFTGVVFTVGATVASLALLPAFLTVFVARASVAPSVEEARGSRDDSAAASRAQMIVGALKPLVSATTTPSVALEQALELQPRELSITSITYEAAAHKLVLSGVADERGAVNVFSDALKGSGVFTNVNVPVAALAGTQEGRFTMTLTGTF